VTELLLELGFFLFVAVIFGAPLLFLVWLVARRRWWWVIVFGGALTITFGLGYLEILLEPPEGPKRVLFWPADLLIWAVGPGPRFPDGRYEWTPAHDMAMYVGYGASWAFWLTIARIVWSAVDRAFSGISAVKQR